MCVCVCVCVCACVLVCMGGILLRSITPLTVLLSLGFHLATVSVIRTVSHWGERLNQSNVPG